MVTLVTAALPAAHSTWLLSFGPGAHGHFGYSCITSSSLTWDHCSYLALWWYSYFAMTGNQRIVCVCVFDFGICNILCSCSWSCVSVCFPMLPGFSVGADLWWWFRTVVLALTLVITLWLLITLAWRVQGVGVQFRQPVWSVRGDVLATVGTLYKLFVGLSSNK